MSVNARGHSNTPLRTTQSGNHWAAICAFTALSLVVTWPLVAGLGDRVLGAPAPGDSFYYLFLLCWFKDSVFGKRPWSLGFFNPNVFYPFGYNLALSETTLSNIVPALPLTTLLGEVTAYNLIVLLSFVLSGLGTYLLVLYHTRNRMAAFFGAVVFTFSPYRLSHLGAGHLPLMGTQWLPLLLLYLDKMLVQRHLSNAAMAALFYALSALSSWYYAYIFALVGVAYILLRGRPWCQVLWQKQFILRALLFAMVTLLLVGPLALGTARGWKEGSRPESLRYVDQFSASPLDFIYPNVFHPLWGTWLLQYYPQNISENVLFLGLVPLVFAVIALWRQRGGARGAFAWLSLIFAAIALGTTMHWRNTSVYIAVPSEVERLFTASMNLLTKRLALYPISSYSLRVAGAIYLPLPTLLLYLYLPFFHAMRVWARFGLITILGVAVLAGFGWERVFQWFQSRSTHTRSLWYAVVSTTVLGLTIVEFAASPYALGTSKVQAQPVDLWLAQQEGDFAVMMYPINKATSGVPLYATLIHHKKTVYGYGTFFPRAFDEQRSVLEKFPSQESIALLKSWGVRYVLVGVRTYGAVWPQLEEDLATASGLKYIMTVDDFPVYEGDRLLRLLPGTERAFIVDQYHIYEVL